MAILRFLLIALLVYYGLKLLLRLILPGLGRYAVKKAAENMQEQMRARTEGEKVFDNGDVSIRKTDQYRGTRQSNDDEYVDFEEIK